MKTISLYFQVHQPFRLRPYRFFEIGNDHYYYDDYLNESIMLKVAEKCYLPANKLMLELIKKYKDKFKLTFSISGIALDQFELYTPEVIDSFRKLADTGQVEFLAETYSHSLSALKSRTEFIKQVKQHEARIKELFGVKPSVFRNTELIYSDDIGAMVADIGYKGMLTEGAKHVLGWKSPNFLYSNPKNPRLKVLLKNFKLSDDIAFRFSNKGWSEYPLTAEKYVKWLNDIDNKEEIINLFMDYETFGEHQWEDTGIFLFLKSFVGEVITKSKITFSTPGEIIKNHQPIGAVHVPYPISWADEERDLTAWLGNPLQEQAFNKLYSLLPKMKLIDDPALNRDFWYLQVSDHFYYMATKQRSDGDVHSYFRPYNSPYEAFINYMNVLSDFEIRVNAARPDTTRDESVKLSKIISEQEDIIKNYERQLLQLKGKAKPEASPIKKSATGKSKPSAKKSGVKTLKAKTVSTKKTAAKAGPVTTSGKPASKTTKTKAVASKSKK